MPKTSGPDILTHKEHGHALVNERVAAQMLGVAPRTLNWWRARKKGPRYRKIGFLVKYSVADLEVFAGGPLEVPVIPGKDEPR